MTETIVISVGGSLICPDKLDVNFLKRFKEIIIKQIAKGKRFVLVTGGGRTARNYQTAAKELGNLDDEDLDWLGIHSTRINAHLLRTIFKAEAEPKIIKNPEEEFEFNKSILIAAGWKPGNSTDYIAVLLAKKLDVKKVINLSNINYVYDRDPAKFSDAQPFQKMTWEEFRGRFGEEWDPGLNSPFDPVASREAEKNGMRVYIVNGAKLENLDNILDGKGFVGTTIS